MKLTGNILQRSFLVEYKGKEYYVSYLSADYPTLLLNRESWEITNEDGEELQIYQFSSANKKEREKIEENIKIFNRIVGFCIKKFNAYNPKL
ncbi:hypothetical protein HY449_00230 [Candidatus Pacearchaeota archaeon]|nr:hypothetical protein [Candidatus Pacearchaeota archaeon]